MLVKYNWFMLRVIYYFRSKPTTSKFIWNNHSIIKHLYKTAIFLFVRVAECYLVCKHGDKALAMLLEYSKELRAKGDGTTEVKHDLQVALCQAYQLQQQRDMALVVIQVGLVWEMFNSKVLVRDGSLFVCEGMDTLKKIKNSRWCKMYLFFMLKYIKIHFLPPWRYILFCCIYLYRMIFFHCLFVKNIHITDPRKIMVHPKINVSF